MRSILCVPLQIKDTVIGVLQILDKAAGRFDPKDLELVEALAAPAAIAIENARLYEETSELQIFNETIVQSMEEGIVLTDEADTITFSNPKVLGLLGFAQDEIVGMQWRALLPPGARSHQGGKTAVRYETISAESSTVGSPISALRSTALRWARPIHRVPTTSTIIVPIAWWMISGWVY